MKKNNNYMKVAFFEGDKSKFLYQIKMEKPKNSSELVKIIDLLQNELKQIRSLLLEKKLISKEFNQIGISIKNFDFQKPFFEIRHLPNIC